MSGENESSDPDMRVAMARLEVEIKSIQRDQANTNTTMREGFRQIGENLGKNADVLKEAFATFRNDFVPKQEYATVAFQVKVMWGVVTALGALVLTMTAKGLFSGVTL
jgi:hypothetical protein